jgi:hypothetical protein|tara:strand:- start:3557 stop:3748 length:192 start_codon:yes stop_codon:yes gene_type:complete
MKVGDLVRVKSERPMTGAGGVWHEFMGKIGIISAEAKRLHIPAAKVIVGCDVVEFDLDELELL